MSGATFPQIAFFGVLGLALGLAQLLSLRAVVRRYVEAHSHLAAIALHAARLVLIVPAWVVVARSGGAPGLLAAFVGFLVARPLYFYGARKGAAP
jgi:hypothetical protein